ncbi:MAG: hypothetical protein HWD63_02560 [Candidatus Parvibacillus calidus]|nr:MAG: hypothetical protein HWD63_02560 [Candidatus Parvibacillus calidus]
MKTPYITFIVLISVFIAYNLESQNNILKAYTSYSKGEVDKRCDFLYGQYPVGVVEDVKNKINDNTPDDEYAIGLEYNRRLYKGFYVGMNLGYAKLVQDFYFRLMEIVISR